MGPPAFSFLMSIHAEFEIPLCASCAWITDEEKDAVVKTAVCVGACTRELSLTAGNRRATSPAGRQHGQRHGQNLQLHHKISQELIAVAVSFNKLRNKLPTFEQINV